MASTEEVQQQLLDALAFVAGQFAPGKINAVNYENAGHAAASLAEAYAMLSDATPHPTPQFSTEQP